MNQPGTSQIQQNKAALSRNENVPHGRKFISDEERIEQQMAWDTINHHHFNINDISGNLTRRDEAAQMYIPGGYTQKNWVGCAARFPKPLL